ncbi:4828_t:CDS:2, partial [Funneliformis caledonium]
MQKLQDGIVMTNCTGKIVLVFRGLGNNIVGVQWHNANCECRSCEITQEMLNNLYFDIQANGRYYHIADFHFQEIKQAPTKFTKEN